MAPVDISPLQTTCTLLPLPAADAAHAAHAVLPAGEAVEGAKQGAASASQAASDVAAQVGGNLCPQEKGDCCES